MTWTVIVRWCHTCGAPAGKDCARLKHDIIVWNEV